MSDERKIDWDALYAEWQIGMLSNRELAKKYGITEGAIRKRAEKDGWERDVSDAIRKRTQEKIFEKEARLKLISDAVNKAIGTHPADLDSEGNSANSTQSHRNVVEVAADIRAQIVGEHSEQAKELRKTLKMFFGYISTYLDKKAPEEDRAEAMAVLFPKATDSLGSALRTAGEVLERIQKLERQSYAIDGDPRRIEVTGKDGNPIRIKKELDLSGFTVEELAALDKLADAVSGGKK